MDRGITSGWRLGFSVVSFMIALSVAAPTAQAKPRELRAFSMNLHCALGDWKGRLDLVLDHLAVARPDVMSFQEVCRNKNVDMSRYLVDGLEKRGYHVEFWHAVDTHPTFFKYTEQLLMISGVPVHGLDTGRLPSMVFLLNKYLGIQIDGLWVVNTHFHFLFPHIRKAQSRKMLKLWGGRSVLMMGDFNMGPDSCGAKPFKQSGWQNLFPGDTFPSDKPVKSLDGFFLSPDLKAGLQSAIVRKVFQGAPVAPSDHLAVELDVVLCSPESGGCNGEQIESEGTVGSRNRSL